MHAFVKADADGRRAVLVARPSKPRSAANGQVFLHSVSAPGRCGLILGVSLAPRPGVLNRNGGGCGADGMALSTTRSKCGRPCLRAAAPIGSKVPGTAVTRCADACDAAVGHNDASNLRGWPDRNRTFGAHGCHWLAVRLGLCVEN
jgi:hypothetical protein